MWGNIVQTIPISTCRNGTSKRKLSASRHGKKCHAAANGKCCKGSPQLDEQGHHWRTSCSPQSLCRTLRAHPSMFLTRKKHQDSWLVHSFPDPRAQAPQSLKICHLQKSNHWPCPTPAAPWMLPKLRARPRQHRPSTTGLLHPPECLPLEATVHSFSALSEMFWMTQPRLWQQHRPLQSYTFWACSAVCIEAFLFWIDSLMPKACWSEW